MSLTITNLDPRPVALGPVDGHEANVYFAGTDTFAKGTLLGRKTTSADSYTGVIVGTGVKTIALTAMPGRSMKVGAYVLTVGNVTAGVGPATLVDPEGYTEAVTLATSGAHDVGNLGVSFAITAGGTELDDNDTVTFTVVAPTGKPTYGLYVGTGVNGCQYPTGVLLDQLAKTGSGNELARVVYRGELNFALLVIDADGDNSNINGNVLGLMRDAGLYAFETAELGVIDNPQS